MIKTGVETVVSNEFKDEYETIDFMKQYIPQLLCVLQTII